MEAVLITGAAGYIGRQLIQELCDFSSSNFQIIAIDRQESFAAREWMDLKNNNNNVSCISIDCDLSSESDLQRCLSTIVQLEIPLRGVIHLASFVGTDRQVGWNGDLGDQSAEVMRAAMQVSILSLFEIIKVLKPLLKRSVVTPSVVSVGSIYGSMAPDFDIYRETDLSNPAAYGVCKAGLSQLMKWFASYFGANMRFNVVVAGGIERRQPLEFQQRYLKKVPLKRMATETDIVRAIIFLLGEDSSYITGQEIFVDGGYSIL